MLLDLRSLWEAAAAPAVEAPYLDSRGWREQQQRERERIRVPAVAHPHEVVATMVAANATARATAQVRPAGVVAATYTVSRATVTGGGFATAQPLLSASRRPNVTRAFAGGHAQGMSLTLVGSVEPIRTTGGFGHARSSGFVLAAALSAARATSGPDLIDLDDEDVLLLIAS